MCMQDSGPCVIRRSCSCPYCGTKHLCSCPYCDVEACRKDVVSAQRPVAQGPARRSQHATTWAATAATDSTTEIPARRSITRTPTATTDPERFVTEEVFQSSLERLLQQIREEVRAEMVATPQLPAPVTSAPQALFHSKATRYARINKVYKSALATC